MEQFDFEFDFEHDLSADVGQPAEAPQSMPPSARKNYRQTVCRHWLRGLCMKGNNCGFLHQFDKQRMPTCRFFAKYNECKEPDCPFKHSLEDVKDCNMFKLGFCIHGSLCRYRHASLNTRSPPVAEAALIGRPGHLHGAPSHSQRSQLVTGNQPRDISATVAIGNVPPPLPPGPPPATVRRSQNVRALPSTNATSQDPIC